METKLLYMDNSYLKEFNATVIKVDDKGVILDKTAFYPGGGGLPNDTGYFVYDDTKKRVVKVFKDKGSGGIYHVLEDDEKALKPGDSVKGIIDWEKRYRVMRMHTGLHVLIAVLNKMTGALVTGNQVGVDRSRVDVNLERPDRELVLEAFRESNEIIKRGINVKIYYLPRKEAEKIEGLIKLAKALPPAVSELRIVEIPGIDIQADGGPHVRNTSEVGELVFIKLENKGRNNRRIYFTIKP